MDLELSPMYQSIILEQLIDLIIICKAYNKKVDKNLFEIVSKMFDCLCGVQKWTNCIFNDTITKCQYSKFKRTIKFLNRLKQHTKN